MMTSGSGPTQWRSWMAVCQPSSPGMTQSGSTTSGAAWPASASAPLAASGTCQPSEAAWAPLRPVALPGASSPWRPAMAQA